MGADESNHPGNASLGEIILATFSFNYRDGITKFFSGLGQENFFLQDWVSNQRDYLFCVLNPRKHSIQHSNNLPFFVPFLLDSFLTKQDFIPKSLNLYFDGEIDKKSEDYAVDKIYHLTKINDINISAFPKGNHKMRTENGGKEHTCPILVYYADLLSHDLFLKFKKGLVLELDKEEKFVSIENYL